jgi:hypothetical protein
MRCWKRRKTRRKYCSDNKKGLCCFACSWEIRRAAPPRRSRWRVDYISENDMDSLLRHMVDMTGHRDHAMLDISVVAAVQELAAAAQTRVLSISTFGARQYVRVRASIGTGGAARVEDLNDLSAPGEPMEDYPELAACLARHETSIEACGLDGTRSLWLPIWFGDKATTCIEIVRDSPLPCHHHPHGRRHRRRLSEFPESARLQRTRFAYRPAQPQDLRRPARTHAAMPGRAGAAASGPAGTALQSWARRRDGWR